MGVGMGVESMGSWDQEAEADREPRRRSAAKLGNGGWSWVAMGARECRQECGNLGRRTTMQTGTKAADGRAGLVFVQRLPGARIRRFRTGAGHA